MSRGQAASLGFYRARRRGRQPNHFVSLRNPAASAPAIAAPSKLAHSGMLMPLMMSSQPKTSLMRWTRATTAKIAMAIRVTGFMWYRRQELL